ncbi:hypothetical protein NDI85_21600 [Halomicroarcula sp. S1AR25-4]|nr:hypothetical protein [Halomicroarcula sp. S1AR25-4]MDS0280385.1 hypothetical protein [Halomicroarcula sp. S1AR25-4]
MRSKPPSDRGNHYSVDHADTGGDIDRALCDASSATLEAYTQHMEAVHDC